MNSKQESSDIQNWASKNSISSQQRPQTQQNKSRGKAQRPPSQFEQRNISSSSSSRRDIQQNKIDMAQTQSGGFNYFNYLKDTQSRQSQIKATSAQKQYLQQQQILPQQSNNQLLRHNSQNMIINQKFLQTTEDYNIHQIMRSYTNHQDEDSPPRAAQNINSKVGSSKSSYNIKQSMSNSKPQNQQYIPTRQPNNFVGQDNYPKPLKSNTHQEGNLKKYKLDSEIIKDIEKNMAKIQPNTKQGNSHQMASTLTNFPRF